MIRPRIQPSLPMALIVLLLTATGATAQPLPPGKWAAAVSTDTATYPFTLEVDADGQALTASGDEPAALTDVTLDDDLLSFRTRLWNTPFHCRLSKQDAGLYQGDCEVDDQGQPAGTLRMHLEIPEPTAPATDAAPETVTGDDTAPAGPAPATLPDPSL